MNRTTNAKKNIIFGYLGNIISLLIKFISRTVFIWTIGATYLGVNGLYTNILSILSFAELGIGTAMNYSLYKPVADKDDEKVKAIMVMYKKAYRLIAIIIAVVGLLFVPFLDIIIRDAGNLTSYELTIYYLIYLYNTVSTYFVSYKYSLVNANQKNYIQTNIQTITTVVTVILQTISLLIFESFLIYLLVAAFIQTLQIIFVNKYLNRKFPLLIEESTRDLSPAEKDPIKANVKALIYHKIGEIAVYSTDDIVISAFINLRTVGLMSNYNLIINSVHTFISITFNSVVSGIGNFIASEKMERQITLFNIYYFIGFWVFGFASIAFIILLNPFIELWLGETMLLNNVIVYLLAIDYYMKGHRIIINNYKTAAGVFDADKYLAIIQAVVSLLLSVILVQIMGLPGVYLATILQGLIANAIKPIITYNEVFKIKPKIYFIKFTKYILAVFLALIVVELIKSVAIVEVTIKNVIFMVFIVLIVPNIIFALIFKNTDEFQFILNSIRK